jgi:hypothetical protein
MWAPALRPLPPIDGVMTHSVGARPNGMSCSPNPEISPNLIKIMAPYRFLMGS